MKTKLKNRIYDEYFNGASNIKLDDIQNSFRSLCAKENSGKKRPIRTKKKAEKEKDVDVDQVKITLFYFLEAVLLSTDPNRNVSPFNMSMVDDLDMFNSFP